MESILSVINIQQLVNFVTVVEQRGFLAASEYLHMEQSSVSKSIWRLEEALGFPLFVKVYKGSRTFREAKLTEQGKYLYQCWAPALREIESAYRRVAEETALSRKTINVGYTNTTDPDLYLWPILNPEEASGDMPDLNVEAAYRARLIPGLADGTYDVVFVPDIEYFALNPAIMDWKYAAVGDAQILVSTKSRIYQMEKVTVEDIREEPFFILNDGESESPMQVFRNFFEEMHMNPPLKKLHKDAFNIGNAFSNQDALFLVDQFYSWGSGRRNQNLKKIPLEGYFNGIMCVWRKDSVREKDIRSILNRLPDLSEIIKSRRPVVKIW